MELWVLRRWWEVSLSGLIDTMPAALQLNDLLPEPAQGAPRPQVAPGDPGPAVTQVSAKHCGSPQSRKLDSRADQAAWPSRKVQGSKLFSGNCRKATNGQEPLDFNERLLHFASFAHESDPTRGCEVDWESPHRHCGG